MADKPKLKTRPSVTIQLTEAEHAELTEAVAASNTDGPGVVTASSLAKWATLNEARNIISSPLPA